MARVKWVEIVNRTTIPLDVMFDGVPDVVPPGYKVEGEGDDARVVPAGRDGKPATHICELHAAECYKRQHPLMGSQDPFSLDANDTIYLLGVEGWGDEVSYIEQNVDARELIDRSLLPPDRQNVQVVDVPGSRRIVNKMAKQARKKAMVERNKRRARYVETALKNPIGIKASYD